MTLHTSEAIRYTLIESGLEKTLLEAKDGEEGRLQNAYELVSHATRYDMTENGEGILQLLEDAALMSDQDALEDRKQAVSLMTIHASKGLEFDCVFVLINVFFIFKFNSPLLNEN